MRPDCREKKYGGETVVETGAEKAVPIIAEAAAAGESITGRVGAIILAAGRGTRMGGSVRKQYLQLAGRPLIAWPLETFDRSAVDEIVLVVGPGEIPYAKTEILQLLRLRKPVAVVEGGAERYHSVYEGLKALENCDYVLIHDGARPLVTEDIIARAIAGARNYDACVVGMPVKDTIKEADPGGFSVRTPDRSRLWQIQTPQAFSYVLVRAAYDRMMGDVSLQQGITDDAMAVERMMGHPVKLIEGSYQNIKVTTPEDLPVARLFLTNIS